MGGSKVVTTVVGDVSVTTVPKNKIYFLESLEVANSTASAGTVEVKDTYTPDDTGTSVTRTRKTVYVPATSHYQSPKDLDQIKFFNSIKITCDVSGLIVTIAFGEKQIENNE